MSKRKKYIRNYSFILGIIFILNLIAFYPFKINNSTLEFVFIAYLINKIILLFSNFVLPFKNFHFTRIVYNKIVSCIIGLLLCFVFLKLYNDYFITLLDCALCLISIISLKNMHLNKNARKNNI